MIPKPVANVSTQFLREVSFDVNARELAPWERRELAEALVKAADLIEQFSEAWDARESARN